MRMLLPVSRLAVTVACRSDGTSPISTSAPRAARRIAGMLMPVVQFRLQRPQSEQRPKTASTQLRAIARSKPLAPTSPGTSLPAAVKCRLNTEDTWSSLNAGIDSSSSSARW